MKKTLSFILAGISLSSVALADDPIVYLNCSYQGNPVANGFAPVGDIFIPTKDHTFIIRTKAEGCGKRETDARDLMTSYQTGQSQYLQKGQSQVSQGSCAQTSQQVSQSQSEQGSCAQTSQQASQSQTGSRVVEATSNCDLSTLRARVKHHFFSFSYHKAGEDGKIHIEKHGLACTISAPNLAE
jgi:hypothetical protein